MPFSDVPVPSACVITVCLFILQHYGSHKIGFMFAPIVTIWLLFIGGVGIYNIFHWNPEIFSALSPVYMYRFVRNINKDRWKSLGSILLCIAGRLTCSLFYTSSFICLSFFCFSLNMLFMVVTNCVNHSV